MGRAASGQWYTWTSKSGVVGYGVRFRYRGKRRFVKLSTSEDYPSEKAAEKAARTAMADLMADVRRDLWVPPEDRQPEPEARPMPSFHQFASEWYADRVETGGRDGKGLSQKGQEDLTWQLSHHLLPYFAEVPLDRIGVEDVDRYRRLKVEEKRLSAHSINRTIGTLSAILEVAVEYDLIAKNPAKGRRRRLTVERKERSYLSRAVWIAALVEAAGELDHAGRARPYRRALVATLVYAGPRISEATGLTWDDVDLAGGVLRIRGSKTANATRTVRLLPCLRDELAALAAVRADRPAGALVFPTGRVGGRHDGGRQHSASNVRQRVLRPAVELANERLVAAGEQPMPEVTPHSLRRSFASLLIALGRDPATVMRQLGHATPGFTLSTYAMAMDLADGEQDRLRALVEGTLGLNGQEMGNQMDGAPAEPEGARAA